MPSPSKSKVYFLFQGKPQPLPNKIRLMKLIESIFKKEKRNLGSINYIFCSDEFLREINKKYLGNSYYTDVISFDLSENKTQVIAEVYISVPRVKENAKIFNTSFKSELYRVIIHGSLHLCGFYDKTSSQIKKMRERENLYLSKIS